MQKKARQSIVCVQPRSCGSMCSSVSLAHLVQHASRAARDAHAELAPSFSIIFAATKDCLQNETFSDKQKRAKVSEYLKREITTDAGYNAAVAELPVLGSTPAMTVHILRDIPASSSVTP
eukprot:PhM_4_TR10021/c1_g3_i3/m.95071